MYGEGFLFPLTTSSDVNLAGILEEHKGRLGRLGWGWSEVDAPQKKNDFFSLKIACFGQF